MADNNTCREGSGYAVHDEQLLRTSLSLLSAPSVQHEIALYEFISYDTGNADTWE